VNGKKGEEYAHTQCALYTHSIFSLSALCVIESAQCLVNIFPMNRAKR
jgi:hypothetical protein